MRPERAERRTDGEALAGRFRALIARQDYPCVGAKSAMARGSLTTLLAKDFTRAGDDLKVYAAILDFVRRYRRSPGAFQSLAVLFEEPATLDEAGFEGAMWNRLQALTDIDVLAGQPGDPRVSAEVEDPRFSLSFGGEAFFVIGLHPAASRPARRFERPALVFNPHDQFERLRSEGRYDGLRAAILERDIALAGSVNPMLSRFGEISEARQYSGRRVGDSWRCPFSGRRRGRT